jgi:TonB family protein
MAAMMFLPAALRRTLVCLFLTLSAAVSARAQTALCVVRDDKVYVVQKVALGSVYIKEGSKLVALKPLKTGLVPVKEFHPLFVSVRDLNVKTPAISTGGGGTDLNNEFHFSATFASPYFLADAFLVLELEMEHGVHRIFYQEIGDIQPGKPRDVRVIVPLAERLGSDKFELHLFTQGWEVFTSMQPRQLREDALDQMVAKRLKGVKNAPPQLLVGPDPEYPAALRQTRVPGKAVVAIRITPQGAVADPWVVQASDPAFGEAALVAVRQWRYIPQVKAGHPVETRAKMPFDFEAPAEEKKR